MNNAVRAIAALDNNTLCVIAGEREYTSDRHGIAPIVELIESGEDFSGGVAADIIVGKAAALLYAHMGIKTVYARVLSQGGKAALEKAGIAYSFGTLAEYIINRKGDGMCPMEQTVQNIDDPSEALAALKSKLAQLRQ